jgi:hypothetical protein
LGVVQVKQQGLKDAIGKILKSFLSVEKVLDKPSFESLDGISLGLEMKTVFHGIG